jgi:hypothetical protein
MRGPSRKQPRVFVPSLPPPDPDWMPKCPICGTNEDTWREPGSRIPICVRPPCIYQRAKLRALLLAPPVVEIEEEID